MNDREANKGSKFIDNQETIGIDTDAIVKHGQGVSGFAQDNPNHRLYFASFDGTWASERNEHISNPAIVKDLSGSANSIPLFNLDHAVLTAGQNIKQGIDTVADARGRLDRILGRVETLGEMARTVGGGVPGQRRTVLAWCPNRGN